MISAFQNSQENEFSFSPTNVIYLPIMQLIGSKSLGNLFIW